MVHFITTINSQQHEFKSILSRYWFLLTSNPVVANFVSKYPFLTFRRSRSFRDCLTTSHFDPSSTSDHTVGTFRCGSCAYCDNLDTRSMIQLPDGMTWTSRHHVDCNKRGIVYLLNCPCGAFYLGITPREFHRQMCDHVYAANIGYHKPAIGKHVASVHNYAHTHITFIPLMDIPPNPRGGDWE